MIKRVIANKLRGPYSRFKAMRRRKFLEHLYQLHRDNYYSHASTLTIAAKAKVSILVPCYNTPPKYFEPLLSSILPRVTKTGS
jgi:hypothetical protein